MSDPISDGSAGPGVPAGPGAPGVPPVAGPARRSPLSDGEWHRLHPLTPVLRGGLFLLVVVGILIANMRDRVVAIFLPDGYDWDTPESGAIDAIIENDLILIVAAAILGLLLLLIAFFWVSWRFHTFRITEDDVEVRSGILFRTHRRAPLDRVQGVNLTRPMIARLLGAAKLDIVGAGADGNVKLEYLTTTNAEQVRGDILRLASGRQLDESGEAGRPGRVDVVGLVGSGLSGLIDGVDTDADEPEAVVRIPTGRVIGSHLWSDSAIWLILMLVAIAIGSIAGTPWVLFSIIPAMIGFGAYWFRSITRALRYSIAPTRQGLRITSGLFTTITEILPPGRIHAVQVRQPLMWRPMKWWSIRINRLNGASAMDAEAYRSAEVLPVGTLRDVEQVLRLMLPDLSPEEWADIVDNGLLGPRVGDGYRTTPRRARVLRPLSWRRNGFLLGDRLLLLRRGYIWRSLVVLPLARLQSLRISQGPIDRALGVAGLTGHTVLGQVTGEVSILDRDDALAAWQEASARIVQAAAQDRSHRWGAAAPDAGASVASADGDADAPAAPDADVAAAPVAESEAPQ